MPKKKKNFERTLDRAARMIQAQIHTLPAAVASQKVKELTKISNQSYGKSSKT
jgi:hypothetical protein